MVAMPRPSAPTRCAHAPTNSTSLDALLWLRRLAVVVPPEFRRPSDPVFVVFPEGGRARASQRLFPVSAGMFADRVKKAAKRVLGDAAHGEIRRGARVQD